MKTRLLIPAFLLMNLTASAQALAPRMAKAAQAFLETLTPEQRPTATFAYADEQRFDWHYVPRERKGLSMKFMTEPQRQAAMALLRTALSDPGYAKVQEIIDLENVLRVLEKRPPNDTRRDPENFAFTVFGDPTQTRDPWGWRMEGHHISLNFSSVDNRVAYTPSFFGSNPGHVLIDVPQKGKRVLGAEEDLGFKLLNALTDAQKKQVILGDSAPWEIFTENKRKAQLTKFDGLAMGEMTADQKKTFLQLVQTYLDRYHVTLAKQQMKDLEKAGLDNIYFAWIGDREPAMGRKRGHYYRIHGPTFLIEFDNTQNDANHIHTVVRDLTNDWGEDLLQAHYQKQHSKK